MKTNISSRQLMLLMLTGITGTIFFGAVRLITTYAGTQGFMAIAAGTVLSLLVVAMSAKAGGTFPEKTPFEYAETLFGKILGKVIALSLVLFNLVAATLILRALGDFVITSMLPDTPLSATVTLMLLLVAAGVYMGLESLARFNEGFYPLILLSWVLVIVVAAPRIDLGWFKPLLDIDLSGLGKASLVSGTLIIDGLLVLMLYPYVRDRKLVLKYCTWSVVLGALIIMALQTTVIGLFSPALAKTFTFPVLQLAQDASMGIFLERVEAIYLAVWIVGTFMRIAIVFYASCIGLSQVVGKGSYRAYIIPLAIMVFYLSFQAANVPESFNYDDLFAQWGVFYQLGLVVLIMAGVAWRKVRTKSA